MNGSEYRIIGLILTAVGAFIAGGAIADPGPNVIDIGISWVTLGAGFAAFGIGEAKG